METKLMNTLLAIAALVGILGFIADLNFTKKYGGVDLRNRVVAARVATELNQDPYYFKWTEGSSDRFLDPADNAAIPVARVTVPPTALLFQSLISRLPYLAQRYIWFFFQWFCMVASIFLLTRLTASPAARKMIWILGLLFISGAYFWRLHVERGQLYIFYVFLFALSLASYQRISEEKKGLSLAGLILGYLISLRPPFLFALIPFLLYKKFRFLSFAALGLGASILLTSFFLPPSLWGSFYNSASFQGTMRTLADTNFRAVDISTAEGMDLKDFLAVPGEDSSLQRIIRALFNRWLGNNALLALLLAAMALAAAYLYKFKMPEPAAANLFFAGIALVFLSEFFIPAPRWPYANVIWLIPLAFIVISAVKIQKITPLLFIIFTLSVSGLLFNVGFHLIPYLTLLGDFFILLAVFLFLFYLTSQKIVRL
ncbi:MAG: glycosyltransferase family 87 protein [bacterium]|nr:glycosyltransferase family 87 protein [bacterium]